MGARISRLRKHREAEDPSVNLTPLIDVVFSILIMFIVVAPILELNEVELADGNPDPSSGAAVKEGGEISIHVQQNNSIRLNQRVVELPQLAGLLKEEKKRHPSARPQIYHDKRAQFGTYQSIRNAAEKAGFQQMDVILKPA